MAYDKKVHVLALQILKNQGQFGKYEYNNCTPQFIMCLTKTMPCDPPHKSWNHLHPSLSPAASCLHINFSFLLYSTKFYWSSEHLHWGKINFFTSSIYTTPTWDILKKRKHGSLEFGCLCIKPPNSKTYIRK